LDFALATSLTVLPPNNFEARGSCAVLAASHLPLLLHISRLVDTGTNTNSMWGAPPSPAAAAAPSEEMMMVGYIQMNDYTTHDLVYICVFMGS